MVGNPAEARPCGLKWVTEANAHRGARLSVVDPRYTHTASVSDSDAPICPGSDTAFRPPRVRDFAEVLAVDKPEIRRVLKLGHTDQIARDHFFARTVTAEMVEIVQDAAAGSEDGWFTAPAFRDRVQNGRKVAVEIRDILDRLGVTLGRSDLRRSNLHRVDLFGPSGGKSFPVGRPVFKTGWKSEPVSGGFDLILFHQITTIRI